MALRDDAEFLLEWDDDSLKKEIMRMQKALNKMSEMKLENSPNARTVRRFLSLATKELAKRRGISGAGTISSPVSMPIKRGKDKNGSFYRWGNHGAKYYYTARNAESRLAARQNAEKQAAAAYSNGYEEGEGLKDLYHRVKLGLSGERETIPPDFERFVKSHASMPIQQLFLGRKPLQGALTKVADFVSRGNFSKRAKELGYDRVFHTYLIVKLADGFWLIEKNYVVQFRKANANDWKGEIKPIPVPPGFAFGRLIANADARYKKQLWIYDASNTNCQRFAHDIIVANGLDRQLPAKTKEEIQPQNAKELVKSLGYFENVPKAITSAAAVLDRIRQGGQIS